MATYTYTLSRYTVSNNEFGNAASETITSTNTILGQGTSSDTFTIGGLNIGGTNYFGTTYTYGGVFEVNGVAEGFYATANGNTYYFSANNGLATTPFGNITLEKDSTTNSATQWDFATEAPYCFFAGTSVRTPAGDVAVETLKAGDLVTLSDGRIASVSWIGRQTVSTTFADPLRVLPIRIKADALGEGLPARDLLLSAGHALLVDGILIQAGALVNGVSVVRDSQVPSTFIYYHVEVADHSLILAENVPAETFVDNVDRMAFDNWEEHQALVGATTIAEMEYPRAKAARQVPQATRARLLARGEALFGKAMAAA